MAFNTFKQRVIQPWSRFKSKSLSDSSSTGQQHDTSVLQQSMANGLSKSYLLSLPAELHHRILDFLLTPWSLAILDPEQPVIQPLDETVSLKRVGALLISGPPGSNLLLTCRTMYYIVRERYGSSCTGKLILGKVKGRLRLKFVPYLRSHTSLSQFYSHIRYLYVCTAPGNTLHTLNFRKLFPNLRYADCLVHEGGYGPMLRLTDTGARFMHGEYDEEIESWVKPSVNHFLSVESRVMSGVQGSFNPWDDERAIVDMKVLGSIASAPEQTIALWLRWEGPHVRLMARAIRSTTYLIWWERGMRRGMQEVVNATADHESIPQRLRWVQRIKW